MQEMAGKQNGKVILKQINHNNNENLTQKGETNTNSKGRVRKTKKIDQSTTKIDAFMIKTPKRKCNITNQRIRG